MSEQLHGTWRWVKHLDKHGKEDPKYRGSGTYTFKADGSGAFDLPGGLSLPMKWKIVDGLLRFGGAQGGKGQSTVRFELPEAKVLIMHDRYDNSDYYERIDF